MKMNEIFANGSGEFEFTETQELVAGIAALVVTLIIGVLIGLAIGKKLH
jgi:hypothetical protein